MSGYAGRGVDGMHFVFTLYSIHEISFGFHNPHLPYCKTVRNSKILESVTKIQKRQEKLEDEVKKMVQSINRGPSCPINPINPIN